GIRRRWCGTRQAVNCWPPSLATRTTLCRRRSHPTASASSPPAGTIRRGCGTRRAANCWPSSQPPTLSSGRRSRPTASASLLPAGTVRRGSTVWLRFLTFLGCSENKGRRQRQTRPILGGRAPPGVRFWEPELSAYSRSLMILSACHAEAVSHNSGHPSPPFHAQLHCSPLSVAVRTGRPCARPRAVANSPVMCHHLRRASSEPRGNAGVVMLGSPLGGSELEDDELLPGARDVKTSAGN